MSFEIEPNGKVLLDGAYIESNSIKLIAYQFILSDPGDLNLPHFKEFIGKDGTVGNYSNAHFEITVHPDSMSNLQNLVIKLRESFANYKIQLSKNWYNLPYVQLNNERKNELDSLFANRLIFTEYFERPLPKPLNKTKRN